jgi:hypothetical protein
MNLFLKLLTGTLKVLLFMFLQRNTQRRNHQDRQNYRRRHQRSESSSLASEILVAAILNGGSQ